MSAAASEIVFFGTFEPFLTGIMIQHVLMGVIAVQVYDYYHVFGNDAPSHKWFVAGMFSISLLQCTMDYVCLYRSGVTFFDNSDKFDNTNRTLWWEIGVAAVIGSIAHVFFLDRWWKATKSWVVVIIGSGSFLTFLSSSIASCIKFQQLRRLSPVPEIPAPITTWLVSTAIVDIAIATIHLFSITRVTSHFKKTEPIVAGIIRVTFQTSALTTTIAVVNVVQYLALPGQVFHLLPQFSMGKLYVISCMAMLSSRSDLRDILEGSGHSPFHNITTRGPSAQTFQLGAAQSKVTLSSQVHSQGIQISTTYIRDNSNQDINSDSTRI